VVESFIVCLCYISPLAREPLRVLAVRDSMASTDIWSDFEVRQMLLQSRYLQANTLGQTLRHNIKLNTVDRLKQILTGLNEQCSTVFFKSGKKQDIIDRIVTQLDSWRHMNNTEKWVKAKAVLYQVRTSGM
jgi:hypothetical protein